jgi:hypothetical protein
MVLITSPVGTMAADDDYLSALSEEADTLETLGNARRELDKVKATVRKQNKGTAPKRTASIKGMKQLEDQLQRDFPASFQLYQQLNSKDREQVFSEYNNSKDKSHDARIFSAINKIIILQVR